MRILSVLIFILFVVVSGGARSQTHFSPKHGLAFCNNFSDEFLTDRLDDSKWFSIDPEWRGRSPSFFSKKNVMVVDGVLRIATRVEAIAEGRSTTYSTGIVKTKATLRYGYLEVRAKAANSIVSSSFWLYKHTPKYWNEIDVFELCGGCKSNGKYNTNAHIFSPEDSKDVFSVPSVIDLGFDPAENFHVYGLFWGEKSLEWYVDGALLRKVKNDHWHEPLNVVVDSEIMQDWFGLPPTPFLNTYFDVDYVRVWCE